MPPRTTSWKELPTTGALRRAKVGRVLRVPPDAQGGRESFLDDLNCGKKVWINLPVINGWREANPRSRAGRPRA